MTTTKVITNVKAILTIAKPIIVFELAGFPAVVRNPKQALTDLQNSGRALSVQSVNEPEFIEALHDCVGAELTGDLRAFKAGDTYKVTETHPAVTDRNHPDFGTVSIGDSLTAKADGVWVEGFLSIPLTAEEKMRRDIAKSTAGLMAKFMGIGAKYSAPVAATTTTDTFVPEGEDFTPEAEVIEPAAAEALGK